MPLYEYKCTKCGHRFEKIESVTASDIKKCPKCGARAERLLSAPAIQFKGTGWYVTDYAGKKPGSSPGEKQGDGASAKTSEKATDSKPAAAKSESAGKKVKN